MSFQPQTAGFTYSGHVPSGVVYCNGVQVTVSQWDLTCVFTQSTPQHAPAGETDPTHAVVERRVVQSVVMSPQHAKAFAAILDHNVRHWEHLNGEISLAPEIVEQLAHLGEESEE
jgi:hypothetical protein